MKSKKNKYWLLCLIIFIAFFLSLEIMARAFFPEYRDNIQSDSPALSYNKHIYFSNLETLQVRVPYPDFSPEEFNEMNWMVVAGDSISWGYGTPYEDIYWAKLQRMMNLFMSSPYQIVNTGSLGRNSKDMLNTLQHIQTIANKRSAKISAILYQFNFNDITRYNKDALKELQKQNIKYNPLQRKFGKFRYKYLHHSVFFHLIASHARPFLHNRYGTCEERGIDALGQYTWTFGSKIFRNESEVLWREFEDTLQQSKELADSMNADFSIFLSPTIFDVDPSGVHQRFNDLNLDFSCATIKPRERLGALSKKLDIDLIDPAKYVRKSFESRSKENNFTPYYFFVDTNHFTPTTSSYVAEYLMAYFLNKESVIPKQTIQRSEH